MFFTWFLKLYRFYSYRICFLRVLIPIVVRCIHSGLAAIFKPNLIKLYLRQKSKKIFLRPTECSEPGAGGWAPRKPPPRTGKFWSPLFAASLPQKCHWTALPTQQCQFEPFFMPCVRKNNSHTPGLTLKIQIFTFRHFFSLHPGKIPPNTPIILNIFKRFKK